MGARQGSGADLAGSLVRLLLGRSLHGGVEQRAEVPGHGARRHQEPLGLEEVSALPVHLAAQPQRLAHAVWSRGVWGEVSGG